MCLYLVAKFRYIMEEENLNLNKSKNKLAEINEIEEIKKIYIKLIQ